MHERFCIVVPHFDHHAQLACLLPGLINTGLPAIIVDDGSSAESVVALERLTAGKPSVTLIRCPENRGKGSAVVTGLEHARRRDFSHAICLDADGQHDPAAVPEFQRVARAHPDAIVSGLPVFGPDIPNARLYGRMITHVLARLESLSSEIRDAMCGYRVYPVGFVLSLCRHDRVRRRMQFDTEVLVRAKWRGASIRFVPTAVRYPAGGVSHFRMFRDNVRMTLMHLRLLAGLVLRLPVMAHRLAARRGRA